MKIDAERWKILKLKKGVVEFQEEMERIPCGAMTNALCEKVVLPSSLKCIGNRAFRKANIQEVIIPNDVIVATGAFNSSKLSRVEFYGKTIERETFLGCNLLQEIHLENVTEIKEYAFKRSGLRTIVIPDTVKKIGKGAFAYCHSLREVVLSNNLIHIDDEAFIGCPFLKKIVFPPSLKSIGCKAFYRDEHLEEAVLSEGIETIGEEAFKDASALKEIIIPSTVKEIGTGAFGWCYHLEHVEIQEGINKIPHHCFSATSIKELTIPNSVTEIGKFAFSDCSKLTDLILPSTLKTIGNWILYGCENLESLSISCHHLCLLNQTNWKPEALKTLTLDNVVLKRAVDNTISFQKDMLNGTILQDFAESLEAIVSQDQSSFDTFIRVLVSYAQLINV